MEQSLATTLAIAQAMAYELTDYLMGDSLYRQMMVKTPSGTKQPKMTLGALLEAVQSLHWQQSQLDVDQRQRLAAIDERISIDRGAFAAQWQAMLRRELKALLDSWRWYLQDVARNEAAKEEYGNEAHIRTRIDLVQAELSGDGEIGQERRELDDLDAHLRAVLEGKRYVGPRGEESRYPADRSWWLYGGPAGDDED